MRQNTNNNSKILADLIRSQIIYLYRHTWLNFFANFIIATLVAVLFLFNMAHSLNVLFLWYFSILIMSLIRLNSGRQFESATHYKKQELQLWANRYVFYTMMLASVWGLTGVVLFPYSLNYQVIFIIILMTVLLSEIPILATSRIAFKAQISVVLLPIVIQLFLTGSMIHQVLATVVIFMGIAMILASHYICKVLLDFYQMRLKAQQQANTDKLTGIANRRFFDQNFKLEWQRAVRTQTPLALLMIDVDEFKKYNDYYGHLMGDICLKLIASSMKKRLHRAGDMIARHGGEEFAILLPNTPLKNATYVAEKLRKVVLQQKITHPKSSTTNVVTISIGVSCCYPTSGRLAKKYPKKYQNSPIVYPAMLLYSADKAMYQAKQHGRNQVVNIGCGENNVPLLNQEKIEAII